MGVSTIEGKARTTYKTENFFVAPAVLGDELDYVRFVGLYSEGQYLPGSFLVCIM